MNNDLPLRRTALAVAMVAGPALILAGLLIQPTGSDTGAFLEAIRDDPGATRLGAVVLHLGMLTMIAAAFGMADRARSAAPGLAWVGGTLAALGFACVNGVIAVDFWDLALADRLPIGQAAKISDQAERRVVTSPRPRELSDSVELHSGIMPSKLPRIAVTANAELSSALRRVRAATGSREPDATLVRRLAVDGAEAELAAGAERRAATAALFAAMDSGGFDLDLPGIDRLNGLAPRER